MSAADARNSMANIQYKEGSLEKMEAADKVPEKILEQELEAFKKKQRRRSSIATTKSSRRSSTISTESGCKC